MNEQEEGGNEIGARWPELLVASMLLAVGALVIAWTGRR